MRSISKKFIRLRAENPECKPGDECEQLALRRSAFGRKLPTADPPKQGVGGMSPFLLEGGPAGAKRRRVVSGTTPVKAWGSICTGLLFILIPFTPPFLTLKFLFVAERAGFICFAQNQIPSPKELTATPEHKSVLFQGEINANNINIRSDSTVGSKIICIANKGEPVEVIRESYGWYKIRLPKTAPSFIKKNLVGLVDEKTAKVIKDNVNIRLRPDESSPILGKADKNEVINILEEREEWYKIEPLNNSFGWVNKKFVDKEVKLAQEISASTKGGCASGAKGGSAFGGKKENKIMDEKVSQDESVTIEGIIKPYGKVIKRIATHKLITADNNVFLLKGNKGSLDSLNYHKVKVTGKLINPKDKKHTIIEIQRIEVSD